jgi:hypothetical protein
MTDQELAEQIARLIAEWDAFSATARERFPEVFRDEA